MGIAMVSPIFFASCAAGAGSLRSNMPWVAGKTTAVALGLAVLGAVAWLALLEPGFLLAGMLWR
jgi:hypothetical protein